jgi:hypothetical protein
MQLQCFAARSTEVNKMATRQQKAEHVLWFKKTECMKRAQRCYQTECRVDPLSKPSIYAFFKQFFEADFCVKGKFLFPMICFMKMRKNRLCIIVPVPNIQNCCETILTFYEGTKYWLMMIRKCLAMNALAEWHVFLNSNHMLGEELVLLVVLCFKSFLPVIARVSLHQIAKRA